MCVLSFNTRLNVYVQRNIVCAAVGQPRVQSYRCGCNVREYQEHAPLDRRRDEARTNTDISSKHSVDRRPPSPFTKKPCFHYETPESRDKTNRLTGADPRSLAIASIPRMAQASKTEDCGTAGLSILRRRFHQSPRCLHTRDTGHSPFRLSPCREFHRDYPAHGEIRPQRRTGHE